MVLSAPPEAPVRAPSEQGAAQAAPLLLAQGISVVFGAFVVLREVSIALAASGVHAVIGPNGAGKTTLFNALSGFAPLTKGSVRFAGADVAGLAPDRLARLGMARSFQICAVFPELSVEDNVKLALRSRMSGLALLQNSSTLRLPPSAERLLEETGLSADRHRRAADLSYGRRRLLEIVTTLALEPRVLLLDEPMAGLAREDFPAVTALVQRASQNCGVLLVEHNLDVVERLATKVTVLTSGSVLCAGTYQEVARDQRVIDAYIGDCSHA